MTRQERRYVAIALGIFAAFFVIPVVVWLLEQVFIGL
jgi:hypothetical protein